MAKILVTSYMNFMDFFEYEGESFFDTPDFPVLPQSDKDKIINVTDKYLGRLDLVAWDYYKDANLWWVIALANNLRKLPDQMTLNMKLRIPTISIVRNFLAEARRK